MAASKTMLFREKDASENRGDYQAAVAGTLQLVPAGHSLDALADDSARMVEDGLLLDEAEPFAALMDSCQEIADRAHRRN